MTKFFRNTPQKLIKKGNFKRYLLYAIGEILLVMIGILLAVQVNNWNQNRIDKRKEKKALTDLFEEFKLNRQRIEAKQQLRIEVLPELEKYIELISKGEANYQSFQDFHTIPYIVGLTNPSNGVIDALISSGELALISNDSLKYLLADWKDQAGNLHENEQILWDVSIDYNNSFHQIILDPRHDWEDWDKEKPQNSFNTLMSNIAYRNKLVAFVGCQQIVIEECKLVLNAIEEIMTLIEREIK